MTIPLRVALVSLALAGSALGDPSLRVWFSPKGGCMQALVDEIARAKSSVFVQAYSFTSAPIAQALVDAHARGVDVEVIVDRSQPSAHGGQLSTILAAGIPAWVDKKHAIAHNKVMIFDGAVISTGSFNFTAAAEASNAENLLIISDVPLAQIYKANWIAHRDHSSALGLLRKSSVTILTPSSPVEFLQKVYNDLLRLFPFGK